MTTFYSTSINFNDIAQGQDLLGEFTAKDPASAVYDVNTLSDNWTKNTLTLSVITAV